MLADALMNSTCNAMQSYPSLSPLQPVGLEWSNCVLDHTVNLPADLPTLKKTAKTPLIRLNPHLTSQFGPKSFLVSIKTEFCQ